MHDEFVLNLTELGLGADVKSIGMGCDLELIEGCQFVQLWETRYMSCFSLSKFTVH